MSFDPIPFNVTLALLHWLAVVGIVLGIAAVTFTVASIAAAGMTGPLVLLQQTREGFADFLGTSLRRVWAVTILTIRESVRRKALAVFVVFAILFLFAGWFLTDPANDYEMQVKVYVTFVLGAISWLILPVVLLLACWSLPEDIKARSLHTVVTKPVRRHEIVLGRILGFCLVGGVVLSLMGVVGYVWINRQLPPQARAKLTARVPIYGQMSFLDRNGAPAKAGINTGDEWMFRSYIEGNTKSRAIWDFTGLDAAALGQGDSLRLESTVQVFRSYKGNLERGILCQFIFVNEDKKIRAPDKAFEVREFRENVHNVPRKLVDESGKSVDLFDDIIQDGKLRVEVACLSSAQFMGAARPDLFVRLPDKPFAVSYFKGILGIGLMMCLIIILGVMSSCFLKGPVATVLTAFVLFVGRAARPFLEELTGNDFKGGGVLESIYRILKHMNPTVDLEPTLPIRIMQGVDSITIHGMWAIKYLFPDMQVFNVTEYVANGFDVPWNAALLPSLAMMVGYALPWIIVGYYSLKLRELEAK